MYSPPPSLSQDVVVISVGLKSFTLLVLSWDVNKAVFVDQHGAEGYVRPSVCVCVCVRHAVSLLSELDEEGHTLVIRPLVPLPGATESLVLRPMAVFKAHVYAEPDSFPPEFGIRLVDCDDWLARAKAAKVGRFADV